MAPTLLGVRKTHGSSYPTAGCGKSAKFPVVEAHSAAAAPDAPHVHDVRGQADDQKEEDEARPRRGVPDLVALCVEEHPGADAGGGEKREEELARRQSAHAPAKVPAPPFALG